MHGNTNRARQNVLIERFDLDVRKKSHTYSKGNRQKVALIAALACDVELLLLDEPTSGLDPLMEVVFRECVRDAQARGCTVLLSSHMLSEVEALCNQVTIVREGTRVVHGSLADLRSITTSQIVATLPVCDLSIIAGVSEIHWQGGTVRCQVTAAGLAPLMSFFATQGVQQLTVQPPSLEDVFLQHYQQTSEVAQ
jgi:ABC-2 type transport system ATP-binding protein